MRAVHKTTALLKPKNAFRSLHTGQNEKQTQLATFLETDHARSEWDAAKPYNSIPGPKPLPIPYIGNIWRFFPYGTYYKMDFEDLHKHLFETYGPVVKVSGIGIGRKEQIILFDPLDATKMFRNESIWPERESIQSLKYFRTVTRKDFYENHEGLVTSQGKKWKDFRTATNQTMMQPKRTKMYLSVVSGIIDEFMERIRYIRLPNNEMPEDFMQEINKMTLESLGAIALDIRLGCLSNNIKPDSDIMRMIDNVKNALRLMYKLDIEPSPWRFISTPTWRQFVKVTNHILEFAMKHTYAKWEEIKNQEGISDKQNKSILESLLLKTKDPKIPIIMATDVLFAGIDTTSNSIATTIYFLTQNPEKQEKMFQEVKKLLPKKDSPITSEVFDELKYTRAVIKETMRLKPVVVGNQRMAGCDMVIGDYQIKQGTFLLCSNAIMCRMEKYFKRANEFIPERWLRSEANSEISSRSVNPFVFLPFGFGQRSCIGKRFAELELDVVLTKLVRNFKISYHHEPMTWRTGLITSVNHPLRFRMTERPE